MATITVAEAALAADELNSTYIDALAATTCGIYTVPNGTIAMEVRARSDGSDNDDNVVEMYAAAMGIHSVHLHYRRVATLTFTQGTGEFWPTATDPDPATIFFADELAVSNNSWLTTPVDCGVDASADHASYVLNIHGYYKFAFIVSTLAGTTVYVDVRPF